MQTIEGLRYGKIKIYIASSPQPRQVCRCFVRHSATPLPNQAGRHTSLCRWVRHKNVRPFILFTVLLVHLILRISPHHSHHLRSHHLSLFRSFAPDLKLISFTNPFLHIVTLIPSGLPSRILNLYRIKGALALFVLVSGYVC